MSVGESFVIRLLVRLVNVTFLGANVTLAVKCYAEHHYGWAMLSVCCAALFLGDFLRDRLLQ